MITEISVLVGSDLEPDQEIVKSVIADFCEVLVQHGGGNPDDAGIPANSIIIAKFHNLQPEDSEVFLEQALEGALLAVIPVQTHTEPEEEIV